MVGVASVIERKQLSSTMRICIWFAVTDSPWGGGNSFLRSLAAELRLQGHTVHHQPNEPADVVVVNAFNKGPGKPMNPRQVAELRQTGKVRWWAPSFPADFWYRFSRRGSAIVHRIDGVAEFVRGFRTKADDIQPAVNQHTDVSIFQSTYCRTSCAEAGIKPAVHTTINNATTADVFYPGTPRTGGPLRLMGTSWSPNPRKGFATLAALSDLPDVEVWFAGQWPDQIDPCGVVNLGVHPAPKLAEAMRECDAFVHAATNEPCSNSIVEALGCGLPVLYLDSGGNRELTGDFGVEITDDLATNVDQLRAEKDQLREKILDHRAQFLMPRAAAQYLETFQQAIDLVSAGSHV
mgnify:CR=1 FL=1